MARKKCKGIELSVFKGREAMLNRVIFQILGINGPQTVYDIHKQATKQRGLRNTRYASVNKRMKLLERPDYVNKVAEKETKAGFKASIYDLCPKTYLAILLSSIDIEELIAEVNEDTALAITAILLAAKER